MKLSELRPFLLGDAIIVGDEKIEIQYLRKFSGDFTEPGGMTFALKNKITIDEVLKSSAKVIITDHEVPFSSNMTFISTQFARLQMAKLSHLFSKPIQTLENRVHKNPDNTSVCIQCASTAHIDTDVTIGEGSIIYANVTIYRDTIIGKRCILHSNCVIGSDGFGYEKDENGQWFKIAHLGRVVLRDDVEIGAGSCVDRGTLGDTVIEDNVKIDNLVHVAHNVRIGKNSQITANSVISGSCSIGANVWLSPGSILKDGLTIGDNAFIGLGSVVARDVERDIRVFGVPARKI